MIFYLLFIILAVSLVGILISRSNTSPLHYFSDSKNITATIADKTYNLEVADTPSTREKGLMYRQSLKENTGMLFVFEGTSFYPFWMKNTLIPLDIIWINAEKEVVHIKENAQPCENTLKAICNSIIPLKPALYVIELNAGEVEKLNLKTGDKIDFNLN